VLYLPYKDKNRHQLALTAVMSKTGGLLGAVTRNAMITSEVRLVNFHRRKDKDNMAFSNTTILAAWKRSQGRCECHNSKCGHYIWGCNNKLVWEYRGMDLLPGAWEAHHIVPVSKGGPDTVENCQILCIDCHKNTPSYGEH